MSCGMPSCATALQPFVADAALVAAFGHDEIPFVTQNEKRRRPGPVPLRNAGTRRAANVVCAWQASRLPLSAIENLGEPAFPGVLSLVDPMDLQRCSAGRDQRDGARSCHAVRHGQRSRHRNQHSRRGSIICAGAAFTPASCWRSASPGFWTGSRSRWRARCPAR